MERKVNKTNWLFWFVDLVEAILLILVWIPIARVIGAGFIGIGLGFSAINVGLSVLTYLVLRRDYYEYVAKR